MVCRRLSAIATLTLVASGAALTGCGGSGSESASKEPKPAASTPAETATPGPERKWTNGYPNSIAVLGHSGSTGENSDPKQPGVEVRANSWATGTNPEVDSLYSRILEQNPAIKSHNLAFSEGSAGIDQVAEQADELLLTEPKADLIVIQVMDNDMTCPVEPDALADFRARLVVVLENLAQGAPDSRQFLVSQFGSVPTGIKSMTREDRASTGGTGPCDPVTPTVSAPSTSM